MPEPPIEQMYAQIHEHMRESHRKRDQVVAFYVALLAGVFAGWDDLKPLLVPVLGGASLIGFAFFIVLLHYRRWHIKFNNALPVFQHLLSLEESVDLNRCESLWNTFNDVRSRWTLINPLRGVESATYLGFTFVVGIPVHLLIQQLNIGFAPCFGGALTSLVVNVLLVVVLGVLLAAWFLPSSQTFEPNDWMFRWLRAVQPPEQVSTT